MYPSAHERHSRSGEGGAGRREGPGDGSRAGGRWAGRGIDVGASGGSDVGAGEVALRIELISPGFPLRGELDAALRAAIEPLGLPVRIEYGLRVPSKPARQDLNRLPTVKNIIAVAAGKGGVGKSTVSVNVAMALKQLGARVAVLDADIYGPSVPKMLGPATRETSTTAEGDRISPAIFRGVPVMSVAFFVEPGSAVIWRGPMIHKLLKQFLEDVVWGEVDYLIVDLPPGTGDAQLSLAQLIPITGAIIVTTPQEVALIDVRRAVNMFNKLEVPIVGVVENMSHYTCPACGHHDNIFASGGGKRLAQELGVPLLGQVPIDNRVSFGGEAGVPVVEGAPGSEQARVFTEIAAQAAFAVSKASATGPKRSSLLRTVS
ncbi:MAG: Mrp/NBP35 family ATP-binding protein [Nannocystis sp.]|uniref:Mrp/NBP35 family ATP-binding protein n=1 Tax=Nannocystis sp. TaxID=1962667 RepID=UPI002424751A|nr:Mrp/NBP35 family ATP-binding protein [Nannocystis sp.]MBK9758353.1 Mrp/NBP35 family ATP-binding protein [Nannocystis sp.]